jgi:nucleotide-binding universal stress UspA family protein
MKFESIRIEIAAEEAVDLIVTGRKSRTGFDRGYVGSHILDKEAGKR